MSIMHEMKSNYITTNETIRVKNSKYYIVITKWRFDRVYSYQICEQNGNPIKGGGSDCFESTKNFALKALHNMPC